MENGVNGPAFKFSPQLLFFVWCRTILIFMITLKKLNFYVLDLVEVTKYLLRIKMIINGKNYNAELKKS